MDSMTPKNPDNMYHTSCFMKNIKTSKMYDVIVHPFWNFANKVKSRKYQGVFEVKSRVKTWQVRGIWSQQLEH